jgi:Alcohol dehydrogenase GroES-like domain
LVITSPGKMSLHGAAELVPGPGEVVARPVHTGICGTDLELAAGAVDPAYTRYPLVPGHEWSGIIEAAGQPGHLGRVRRGGPEHPWYITTARENFTADDLRKQPHAGDIFACTPGVTGRPPFLFGG